jgi:GH15 family glucan-1,4-alpha-glucosidase
VPDRYPAIEDHAVIGDLHTVALVATDGTIDWRCLPRFDSPAAFASLLDSGRGGCFSQVRGGPHQVQARYQCARDQVPGADSVGEVVDFMVPRPPAAP